MISAKPRFRLAPLVLALAAGVAGPVLLTAPQSVQAAGQKEQKVSQKVGKPLQAAQDLAKKGKMKEALAKVKEAEAVSGKTPFETFKVQEFLLYIYVTTKDYANASKAMEATLDSEFLDPGEKTKRLKNIAQINYQSKNYPKAVEVGSRYLKAAPGDAEMHLMVGQAHYLQQDFANAAAAVGAAVAAVEKAGGKPKEEWLKLIMSAEYERKNDAGVTAALEKLILTYPSTKYWGDRISTLQRAPGLNDRLNLEIYRLALATGGMEGPDEYVEMAELALQAGLPGEARSVLEKGFAAQVLGGQDKDRQTRLLGMAKEQSATDEKSLGAVEAEAAKAPTGEALLKTGEAWLSYGQNDKAVAAIEAGIAKGGLKNPDSAGIQHGLALLRAGRADDAKKAFTAVTTDPVLAQVARLWVLYMDAPPPAATASAAP